MKRIIALVLAFILCSLGATFAESSTEINIDEIFPFTPEEYEPLGYSYVDFVIASSYVFTDIDGKMVTYNEQPTVLENGYSYYTITVDDTENIDILTDSDNNVLAYRYLDHNDNVQSSADASKLGEKMGGMIPNLSLIDDYIANEFDDITMNSLSIITLDYINSMTEFFEYVTVLSEENYSSYLLMLDLGLKYDSNVNGRTMTYFMQSDMFSTAFSFGVMLSK